MNRIARLQRCGARLRGTRPALVAVLVSAMVLGGVALPSEATTSGGVAAVYQVIPTPTSMNSISLNGQWAVGGAQSKLYQLGNGTIISQTAFPSGFAGSAVNDSGVVAGSDNGVPAIYNSGSIEIPTAPALLLDGTAGPTRPAGSYQAINDSGLAVGKAGYSIAGDGSSFSYLGYTDGAFCSSFTNSVCPGFGAAGVNASGLIVGAGGNGYVTWNGGGLGSVTPLTVPAGLDQIALQTNGAADVINSAGTVLVQASTSGQNTTNDESACYTATGGTLSLITSNNNRVDGVNCVGINDSGTVVGEIHPAANTPLEAFVSTPGGGVSLLNTLIGSRAATLSPITAYGISNTGVIVGAASGAGGGYIAFAAHRITGQVTDTGGSPVAGVAVSATAPSATSPVATATTDTNGNYELDVAPGSYTLTLAGVATGLRSDPVSAVADTSSGDTTANFVLTSGPVVQSVSPTSGPVKGVAPITVAGAGFGVLGSADTVQFCAVSTTTCLAGTNVAVASDSSLTVTPPADATSLLPNGQSEVVVDVIVTDTNGTPNLKGASDRYEFDGLGVTGVSPSSGGAISGNTKITIAGSGFGTPASTDQVSLVPVGGGAAIPATNVTVVNDGTVTAVTGDATASIPAGATNLATDVEVTAGGQTSAVVPADVFTYGSGPSVTGLSVTSGPIAGATQLTITGSGFTGATLVSFHGATVSAGIDESLFVSATDSQIVLKTPSFDPKYLSNNAVVTDVEVTVSPPFELNSAVSPDVPADVFTFQGPMVTALSVTSGPIAGGTQLTITGRGFTAATLVSFHGATVSAGIDESLFVSATDSQIVLKTPSFDPKYLSNNAVVTDVEVTVSPPFELNSAVSPDVPADVFTFQGPMVTGLSVTSGPIAGGTQLTIDGSGFTAATAVHFLAATITTTAVTASAFVSASDSQIVLDTPSFDPKLLVNNVLVTEVVVTVSPPFESNSAFSPAVPADRFTFLGTVAPPCGTLSNCNGATSSDPNGSAIATSTTPTGAITATGVGTGGITVGRYPSNPVGAPGFSAAGSFFDVKVSSPNTFTSATIHDCDLLGGTTAQWWNPAANGGAGAWQPVTPETLNAGPPACLTITVNATSSPTLAQLTGTVFATVLPPTKLALVALPSPLPVRLPVVYLASVSKGTATGSLAGAITFTDNGAAIAGCTRLRPILGLVACVVTFPVGGRYAIVATYSGDTKFGPSSAALTQVIYQPPAITSVNHATATLGKPFSFPVTASGYPIPTFGESGALPKGMTFSPAGVLAGTPASKGKFVISIAATSAAGVTRQSFTLTI